MNSELEPTNKPLNNFINFDFEFIKSRVIEIIKTPKEAWEKIRNESTLMSEELKRYVLPLMLAQAVAAWLGMSLVGISVPGLGTMRQPFFGGLISSILNVVVSIFMLQVYCVVFEKIAPKFSGETDKEKFFKLIFFSATPAWILGLAIIYPSIGSLFSLVGGIYSIYLFFSNVASVTTVPAEKRIVYIIVSMVACLIVSFLVFSILGVILSSLNGGMGVPNIPSLPSSSN